MRVALVTTEFGDAVEGGAGQYANSLAEALVQEGVDITVLGPSQQHPKETSLPLCEVAPGRSGLIRFWSRLAAAYRQADSQGQFDVIHGNGIAAVPLLFGRRRLAHVSTIHHMARDLISPGVRGSISRLTDLRGETGIVPLAESVLIRKSDHVIAVSHATHDSLVLRYARARGKVSVIHNGIPVTATRDVDRRDASELRRRWVRPDEALVLAVGRLERRKGVDLLLKAIAGLGSGIRPFRLVVVGAGPVGKYQALADRLGCASRVRLVGWLSPQDLAAAYQACDIFVMASRHEGFGLAAIEAMAAGKPVVVSRTGAVLDGIIDHDCGAVVEPGDVHGFTRALELLLSDLDHAAMLGIRNKRRVEHLSWETTARSTASAYERALQVARQRCT